MQPDSLRQHIQQEYGQVIKPQQMAAIVERLIPSGAIFSGDVVFARALKAVRLINPEMQKKDVERIVDDLVNSGAWSCIPAQHQTFYERGITYQ